MIQNFDIAIVGAGPIGLACAIEAKKNNLSHILIEKGCLVNSIYNYPTNMIFFSTSEKLEIGDVPFISHGIKPTRSEALEYYRRVKDKWNLNVKTYERVDQIKRLENSFNILTDKGEYCASKVIIAVGFYDHPNLMNIPGEELTKVKHYYHEPHPYSYEKIAIIGGGNSAVDVALETFRRGAQVSIIIKGNALEKNVKYWVRPDIENRIKDGDIKAYFNSTLKIIKEKDIVINTPNGEVKLKNNFVLAMTGYKPDYEFLKKIRIKFSNKEFKIPKFNSKTYETNIKGLYLAGVVCGGMNTSKWFIENARVHAPQIMKHILKNI